MKTFLQVKKLQAQQIGREKLAAFLDERGDTNFVSIILIMVIVIAIAGIFRTQLTAAVTNVLGKLTDFLG